MSVASQVLTKLAEVTIAVRVPPFVKGHFTRKPVHMQNLMPFPTHDISLIISMKGYYYEKVIIDSAVKSHR